jgi:hypothetical protein
MYYDVPIFVFCTALLKKNFLPYKYLYGGPDLAFDNNPNYSMKPPPSVLPHSEIPLNSLATLADFDVDATILKWLIDWEVPQTWWSHWKRSVDVQVYSIYPPFILDMGVKPDTPVIAWSADGKRHIAIKISWLNPGVIAHEQAHFSYALLNPEQKSAFSVLFSSLKKTDPLILQLFSFDSNRFSDDVEGHADVYRYIGQHMPEQLKQYYPTLF